MAAKTEFKFNCPICGQHILAATEWIGQQIECPSCQTSIRIPGLSKGEKQPAHVTAPSSDAQANHSSNRRTLGRLPAEERVKGATPRHEPSASPKVQPASGNSDDKAKAASTEPAEPPQPRIAVLTPAVKLGMTRAVRRRILDESAWLPGKVGGKSAYAAKVVSGKTLLVEIKNPEATKFSLLGAFLRELRERQVVRTATGRRRFLDEEIPDAVRDALKDSMSEEAQEQGEASLTGDDWMRATHAQCLTALSVLEQLYSQRMDQAQAEKAKRRLGTTRLPDLVRKLEKKARIAPEDVATALYHELMEVRRRLDRLENRSDYRE